MKTSNKIIFIALAAVGGLILVTAIASRVILGGTFAGNGPAKPESLPQNPDLKDFTEIRASSVWELDIRRGDVWSVTVTASPAARESVMAEKQGSALVLGQRRPAGRPYAGRLRAEITMPVLAALDFSGAGAIRLSGFNGKSLRLVSSGAGAVVCRESAFDDLTVILSGVGSIDFSDAKTKNAEVELSGLGSLKLFMDGGELRGNLSGLGSVEYRGPVSAERINKSGLGSVERKE